jgi:hypothetical protein
MKRLHQWGAAAGALLLAAGAGQAASSTGTFATEEIGLANCGDYLQAKARKSPAYGNYISYIEGYLTAANRYEPNTFDLTPWHNATAFGLILDQHCRANAQDSLTAVALKLVKSMMPLRLTEPSRMVEIRDGANHTAIYEAILKRAQAELGKKGLYQGPADGQFNPQTKAAVQTFQKSARLQPTGVPDPATIWLLLNP